MHLQKTPQRISFVISSKINNSQTETKKEVIVDNGDGSTILNKENMSLPLWYCNNLTDCGDVMFTCIFLIMPWSTYDMLSEMQNQYLDNKPKLGLRLIYSSASNDTTLPNPSFSCIVGNWIKTQYLQQHFLILFLFKCKIRVKKCCRRAVL